MGGSLATKCIVAICSLLLVVPSAGVAEAAWVARAWQTEDGLPQNSVNAVVQTRDGFLWVGTNGGLARFDGVRFRKFGLQDGLRSVMVMALAEDRMGALWIGTSGGGLSRWENGRITTLGANDGFPAGTDVIALAADRDGTLWIGTNKGLVEWKNGAFKVITETQGLPKQQVRALLLDSQATLWVSSLAEGLFRGVNGRFTRVEREGPLAGDVYCLMEDRDGAIWAGANAGVMWKWSGGSWTRLDPANGLPKANIERLAQSSDGTIWIGARNGGLYRSDGARFAAVESTDELLSQSVRALAVDREGSIWAGATSGGLHRFAPHVLDFHGGAAGLPPSAVTSIAEDASGALWVGTPGNGIHRFQAGRFSKIEDAAVPGTPYIYCTTTTSDGSVWAAGEQCLFRFSPGQPARAFLDPPIKGDAIRALCADGESVWLGTYYSALLKCDASGVKVVAPRGTFPGGITSIVAEPGGALWVGTSEGLHRWEQGKVRTWDTHAGLLTASIRTIQRDTDGTLWLGTLGGGLARMKDGRFTNLTTQHGLIDDVISQIVVDDFRNVWLGCNRGLMRIDRRELDAVADGTSAELHPLVFGRNEGMLKEQCSGGTSPNAIKAKDGRLLFPTAGGFAEIDPRRLQNLAPTAPQPGIDAIFIDARPQPLATALKIPPGKHRLEVNYTAPLLRGGEWLRFRYRLEGLDRDWVGAGTRRTAAYEALSPGLYVFRVAAAGTDGEWHESAASIGITVHPHSWQTAWFRAGALLLLIGTSAAAAWWIAHHRHLRRLAELEIERKHQAELAHASRVSLLGELSASLAHELKQPLAAILSNAQAGLRFLNDDEPDLDELRAILGDIATSDRRAAEIITRLRAMTKKGEVQMERRDLNADIEQALDLIHSDIVSRNVTITTQLDPDLPLMNGDHIQLQQVLLNLVINACDAMKDNSPDDRLIVIETASNDSGGVRVSVTDRGRGIPPDALERIFAPFYTTKSHGLGMGLSICRAIVQAHGGQLWAVNNPDSGATFHFALMNGAKLPA